MYLQIMFYHELCIYIFVSSLNSFTMIWSYKESWGCNKYAGLRPILISYMLYGMIMTSFSVKRFESYSSCYQ